MSKATSFIFKISSLTPYLFLKVSNEIQKYNKKEIKTPKVTFHLSFKHRSSNLLFDLLFNLFHTVISHQSIISIKTFNLSTISILSNLFNRVYDFFTFLHSQFIPRINSDHDRSDRPELKPCKKEEEMQEISIYAMAHVPPFPRKSTSNQIRSPLLPNLVESNGLNSKIIPHGIVNTRSERSHSRPSFSSYSSPVPLSVSASTSSNLSLDFQRIRRRKKKLKRVKSWSRDRFESLEDVQDGDADVEKDEDEDESKIVSKIKSRRLKKINSSHSIHPSHSQLQLQLHSFWILICLIFSMMFFKFQSS